MMVPWFYPRDSWQSFIRLANPLPVIRWYPSFDVSTAAVAILESVAEPNLTSEKVRCETTAVFDIPDCWHVHSPQYFTWPEHKNNVALQQKLQKILCNVYISHEDLSSHLPDNFLRHPTFRFSKAQTN